MFGELLRYDIRMHDNGVKHFLGGKSVRYEYYEKSLIILMFHSDDIGMRARATTMTVVAATAAASSKIHARFDCLRCDALAV